MSAESVLSYESLLAQVAHLQKEVRKENARKNYLMKETEIQRQIILQLKNLAKNQTKPLCSLGHRWCGINHQKYNFVRSWPYDKPPPSKNKEIAMVNTCQLSAQKIRKLCRKIDVMQSNYGLPPSYRNDASQDLITEEIAAIWNNVYYFQHNILEDLCDGNLSNAKSFPKVLKPKRIHKSIILESLPSE